MTGDGQDHLAEAQAALSRSELLLSLAEDLSGTTSLVDIRRRVHRLMGSDLEPVYVGLMLAEDGRLRRIIDDEIPRTVETSARQYDVDPRGPTSEAFRRERMVELTDPAALHDGYGDAALTAFTELGLKSAVCVPLPGVTGPVGVLVLGWDRPHPLDAEERAVLLAVAGHTARAVERAHVLHQRVTVAHQLQRAMLTDLPPVSGLEIAALYRPAMTADLVGGDWYDAYFLRLPGGETGGETGGEAGRALAVTVGDITGHDMQAATLMGQVRSMLRQAGVDHPGQGPATSVTALERACRLVLPQATGSLVHAHLVPRPGGWELTWTNAGHPPPILVHPDGTAEELAVHDLMFFPTLDPQETYGPRTESTRLLPPGTLLVMFTDGLIETPGVDLDAATARLLAALPGRAGRALPGLLEELADEMAGEGGNVDDIVVLAVRVPAVRVPAG